MYPKLTIVIIEDDKNICDFIATILTTQGYKIFQAFNGKDGLSLITSLCPDAILLDMGLPDMNGLEVITSVREWSSTPIIVISAELHEQDKVRALDSGADDYITKPFGTSELMARIRTAVRHSNKLTTDPTNYQRPYSSASLVVDFDKHLVTVDGNKIHLTQIEYKIVSLLAKNSGKIMSYESIISSIWGPYADQNNRILRVNMANIRRKIEKNQNQPQYIYTETGIGYRMLEDENISSSIPAAE